MDIGISEDAATRIRRQVQSGRFSSENEVVLEGLRLLEEQQRGHDAWVAETREKLQEALESEREGRVIPGEVARQQIQEFIDDHSSRSGQ